MNDASQRARGLIGTVGINALERDGLVIVPEEWLRWLGCHPCDYDPRGGCTPRTNRACIPCQARHRVMGKKVMDD